MKESLSAIPKQCKTCNSVLTSSKSTVSYCSKICRDKQANIIRKEKTIKKEKLCIVCNKAFIVEKGNILTCSTECSISNRSRLTSTEYKNQHTDFENKKLKDSIYYQNNQEALLKASTDRYYNLTSDQLKAKRKIGSKYVRDREKILALQAVRRALIKGTLVKEDCVICGNIAEAHHPDYTKPLYIIWLCKKHHEEVHRKFNPLILENV